jgi:hypothetical protein
MDEGKEAIKEKIDFYFKNKIKVHIETKDNNFYNGTFFKKISNNIYLLQERILGYTHIFVSDIKSIEDYLPKEEKK